MNDWIEHEEGFFEIETEDGFWTITPPGVDFNDTEQWQLYHDGDVWYCDLFAECNAIYLSLTTSNKYKWVAAKYHKVHPRENFYSLSGFETRVFMEYFL